MLRVLPPTSKPVNNLICCKIGLMRVVKPATRLFNLFCGSVAKKVACFWLPVFPYLDVKFPDGKCFFEAVNVRRQIKFFFLSKL